MKKIAFLSTICFILSLVLIDIGENVSNKGIIFIGLLSLSASTIILGFILGNKIFEK